MKNRLTLLFFLIFFSSICYTTTVFAGDNNFRNTTWGMTTAQVLESEKSKPEHQTDKLIAYRDTISGLNTLVLYNFTNGILTHARYGIVEPHSDPNLYINDFNSLEALLNEKYGNPSEEKVIWNNEKYKMDSSMHGIAVGLGHIFQYTTWQKKTTQIQLALFGEKNEVHLMIEYSDLAFFKTRMTNQKKSDKNKL